jgi:type IV pilus assembly protein PilP
MRSVITLVLGILLAAAGSGLRAQTQPAAGAGTKPAPAATSKAAPQGAKPAAKPATKSATKTAAKKPAKAAASPEAGAAAPAEAESKQARRDPFESLVSRQQAQAKAAANLPPGKAGLQVSTLRLDGIVRAPNGMIAVVTNPQARTYFLREGDQLYDGRVEKIAMDGVSFHEIGKDAFGKPVERQVNKRIYSSAAGEQQ